MSKKLTVRYNITRLFNAAQSIIDSKAHDYSSNSDLHSSFKYASSVAEPFSSTYKSYAMLIGAKLARISELLDKKEPKHESIDDSFVDCLNYIALMYERYKIENLSEL